MAEINTLIDSDDEDNLSVHSAISNPSDFAEDEEVDYLALELLHHLPADKADKLMKSLRAKEKAVQENMGCTGSKQAAKAPEAKKEEVKPEEKKEEPKVEEKKDATPKQDEATIGETVMDGLKQLVGLGDKEEITGDVVDVSKGMQVTHMKRGQSGMVLQHTATDVLVKLGMKRELTKHVPKKFWARKAGVDISCSNLRKYDDGKTEWTEIEDLKKMDASSVREDKASPEIKVEGAGDSRAMCSCGWL
eukprot:g14003.t1